MKGTLLYHWTHWGLLKTILTEGLRTDRAQGRTHRVYACVRELNAWAITHVADRHAWHPDDMVCLAIHPDGYHWERAGMDGVYYSVVDVAPIMILAYKDKAERQTINLPEHGVTRTPSGQVPAGKTHTPTPTQGNPRRPAGKPVASAPAKGGRKKK